jgi:hypothetical protein
VRISASVAGSWPGPTSEMLEIRAKRDVRLPGADTRRGVKAGLTTLLSSAEGKSAGPIERTPGGGPNQQPTHARPQSRAPRSDFRIQLGETRPYFGLEVQAVRVEEIRQVNEAGLDYRQPFTVLIRVNARCRRVIIFPGHKAMSDAAGTRRAASRGFL